MFISTAFQRILASFAVVITLGILLHDTKTDRALMLTLPVATITVAASSHAMDLSGTAHTHVERVSLHNALASMPRVQPRDDHKKYVLKNTGQRTDFFGGSMVLWPSV